MKIKKFLKTNKVPLLITSGVILAGLVGGSYYLAKKQDSNFGKTNTNTEAPTSDAQVQQNVEQKNAATSGDVTTTPSVVAEKPAASTSLADVSLSVYKSDNTADVTLYGPSGTYGIEKLVSGTWSTLIASFDYSGRGGRTIDTITSAAAETHYRVFLIQSGSRVSTSGDTSISWQQLLNNGGTMSVPVTE